MPENSLFNVPIRRLYALAASWGMFLGMLTSACVGSVQSQDEPLIGKASLAAPSGAMLRETRAVTQDRDRRWIAAATDFTVARAPEEGGWLGVEVDHDGRVYTLDLNRGSVLVFAPGQPVQEWGADAGLQVPAALAVAGDRLYVADLNPLRLLSWDLDGDLVSAAEVERFLSAMTGLDDGTVVTQLMEFGPLPGSVSTLSPEGREVVRFTDMPTVAAIAATRETLDLWPSPTFAAGPKHVYVTSADAYEVLAFDYEGDLDWALRAPWPRAPIPEERIQRSLERSRRVGRAMRTNVGGVQTTRWPDHYPALAGLAVDGRGRLYVFPYVAGSAQRDSFPVDVYSPEGELLVNGMLPFAGWDAALGDRVYRLEQDATGARIVAYRLELPVERATTVALTGQ